MSRVKVLAVFAVLIALVVLLSGLSMKNTYSIPQAMQECISSEAFTMPANTIAYRSIALNQSGSYYIIVNNSDDSYTVFSSSISEVSLEKWLNGQFNVSWDGTPNGNNAFGLSGPCKFYVAEISKDSTENIRNIVFWNPESVNQQINLIAYREWTEMDYSNLNMGNLLTEIGAVSFIAIATFFVVKNRAQVKNFKMTRRKTLALTISLIMLASGVFLTYAYSDPVKAIDALAQGTITVPANGYQSIVYVRSSSGNYYFQVDTNIGTIQAFFNLENSTKIIWTNGTLLDIRDIPSSIAFNGSSGEFGYGLTQDRASSEYLFLSNPDSFSKEVSYSVWRSWTYNNYFGLLAGISLISLGTIVLFLAIFKNKLRDFNKALEKQE